MNIPQLPERPSELGELESRRKMIRQERQEVENELQSAEEDLRRKSHRNGEDLEAAAERLAAGVAASRDDLPEQAEIARGRLAVLRRAEQKLAGQIAEGRGRHSRQVAAVLRPAHMEVTQQIAKALIALVTANEVEEQLRAAHPGIPLEPMSFPNTGKLGPGGGSAQIWLDYVRNRGYLGDDNEPEWPAAG